MTLIALKSESYLKHKEKEFSYIIIIVSKCYYKQEITIIDNRRIKKPDIEPVYFFDNMKI
jgi:hypothetical protein